MKMPSKQQVLDASESCPDAKETLKKLFPEAFEGDERDVTKKLTFNVNPFSPDSYYIDFLHKGNAVGYVGSDGITVTNNDFQLIEQGNGAFKILKTEE